MYRRAYVLLVGNAVLMGAAAIIVAIIYDKRLIDPEGSFLGPSWLRLPLLLLGALLLDMLPRTLWYSKMNPRLMPGIVRERWRRHWTRERLTLVGLGVSCFYIVYVSYRNLKSFLPFVRETKYDRELHMLDRMLLFGHDPATFLHGALGDTVAAYPLSYIYLWFLPLVPLAVTAWLVWSRNLSYGYWFVTSQCVAWTLGTASYYALPTLGPGLEYTWLYEALPNTPTSQLMDSLVNGRHAVIWGVSADAVQSVAGFASAALRDHAAGRLGRAVHRATRQHPVDLLGQLRRHRDRHPLLRLALHRRRPGRHHDRLVAFYVGAHRHRTEVRPARARLAPDDDHVGHPRRPLSRPSRVLPDVRGVRRALRPPKRQGVRQCRELH